MSYVDLITCPICLEHFTKPRYLPCLHTYCEECLSDYISAAYKKDDKGFNCPTCRAFNRVELSESFSAKKTANGFPINHLIMTLLDRKNLENKDVNCFSCSKRGRDAPGKFWCYSCSAAFCETCGEFHTSLPILADHRIAPIDESTDASVISLTAHDVCETHPGKKLEMFCHDHDLPCCATCTMVTHRKCESVVTLEDAAKSFKDTDSNDTEHVKDEIKSLIAEFDCKLNDSTKKYKELEATTERNEKEIKEYSDKMVNHVNKLREDFEKTLAEVQSKKMKDISNRKKELANMQSIVSNSEWLLKAVEEKCSRIQLLSLIPKITKLTDEINEKLEMIKKEPITQNIKVIIDDSIEECAKIDSIGKIIEN